MDPTPAERSLLRPLGELAPRRRLFSTPRGRRRSRRATDVVLLVLGGLALAALVLAYPPGRVERALGALFESLPDWLEPFWATCYGALVVWAVVAVGAALLTRRLTLVGSAVAAALGALAIAVVCMRLAVGSWPALDDVARLRTPAAGFPVLGLAVVGATALVVNPYLVRPLQRVSRWILLLGVLGATLTLDVAPSATVTALAVALAAAAGVRLALGTSAGHPETDAVEAALAELGVAVRELQPADRQRAGVFVAHGSDSGERPLLVKVYGRDAYDTQLLEKAWRTMLFSDDGPRAQLSRIEAVEHEALATLLAGQAGIAVLGVAVAAEASTGDALLVLRGHQRALSTLPRDLIDEAMLDGAWSAVLALSAAGIAHHRIDPESVALVDGRIGLVELGRATLGARPDQRVRDQAQLFATIAALVGTERAVAATRRAIGDAGLATLVPFVQPAAFGPTLRAALRAAEIDVDDLREELADAAGIEKPELVRLRRVTWGTAIQVALLVFAVSTIVGVATGLDYDELRTTLDDALWGWVALGFVVAQLPRLAQTFSTMGSVPVRLPFVPVYAMQLASGYMNLALPSNLARMAVNIRFFQRQGIPPATAVTAGAIDSFVSTVVQGILLVGLLLFSSATLDFDLGSPSGPSVRALLVVVLLALGVLGALFAVRRIRAAVGERLRRWWPEVRSTVSGLRAGNKLLFLLGGSLAAEILFAMALGVFAYALGTEVALTQLLLINISVSLLASVLPVPGGIGVQEFGLTLGLTAAGMSEEAALAAVLLYRVATFYLPPLWGFVAMRWLQRTGNL